MSTPNASAISRYTVWQGSPGALIQSSSVMGYPSYGVSAPQVSIFAAHVRRSPATTGAQTVVYEYRVFHWNGAAWTQGYATYGLARTIAAGQSGAVLNGNGYGGSIELPASGIVGVELAVSFYSGSRLLGRFNVWHDQPRDYACHRQVTLYGNCQVHSGGYLLLS